MKLRHHLAWAAFTLLVALPVLCILLGLLLFFLVWLPLATLQLLFG